MLGCLNVHACMLEGERIQKLDSPDFHCEVGEEEEEGSDGS